MYPRHVVIGDVAHHKQGEGQEGERTNGAAAVQAT